MNQQHFGSDPADIQIRIRINSDPEIRIRILDHFLVQILPRRRFAQLHCLSTVSSFAVGLKTRTTLTLNTGIYKQEVQLLQRGRAMLRVTEYFAHSMSLKGCL